MTRQFMQCLVMASMLARVSSAGDVSPERRFADAQVVFDAARATSARGQEHAVGARQAFYEAAKQFAAIADDGVRSPNLCVNAGNAYHCAGDEARALLWYLRAAELTNTQEIRDGLVTLRRLCDAELRPPEKGSIGRALMCWHYDLERFTKQIILLTTYPVGCLLVMVAGFVKRRTVLLRLGITLIVVGLVIGVSDLVEMTGTGDQWAVVLDETRGHAGDDESYSVVLDTVVAGQEVKIIERRPNWVHVELPLGKRCWIRADTCEAV